MGMLCKVEDILNKKGLYDERKCEKCAGDLATCLGDFNGHIRRHIE